MQKSFSSNLCAFHRRTAIALAQSSCCWHFVSRPWEVDRLSFIYATAHFKFAIWQMDVCNTRFSAEWWIVCLSK